METYNIQQNNEFLTKLLDISNKLNSTNELEDLLKTILKSAIEAVDAERGFIIPSIYGEANFDQIQVSNWNNTEENFKISRTIVNRIMNGKTIICESTLDDEQLKNSDSVLSLNILSFISVPIKSKDGDVLGVVYVDHRDIKKKPFSNKEKEFFEVFSNIVAVALERAKLYEELKSAKEKIEKKSRYYEWKARSSKDKKMDPLIGESPAIKKVHEWIKQMAKVDSTILILGETGTGKELVANEIHKNDPKRCKNDFVTVECASIKKELFDSELFGHRKGSFTSATEDRVGLFEIANDGTIFLDEIGDLPLETQGKLLRAVETKRIRRIGENKEREINVRVIAATNKSLEEMMSKKEFREDLYYRLNITSITLPALRERKEDIPLLSQYFLGKFCNKYQKIINSISKNVMDIFLSYEWKGNVRELRNIIESSVISCSGDVIEPDHLPCKFLSSYISSTEKKEESESAKLEGNLKEFICDSEKSIIKKVLDAYKGNKKKSAEKLGIPYSTFRDRVRKLSLDK